MLCQYCQSHSTASYDGLRNIKPTFCSTCGTKFNYNEVILPNPGEFTTNTFNVNVTKSQVSSLLVSKGESANKLIIIHYEPNSNDLISNHGHLFESLNNWLGKQSYCCIVFTSNTYKKQNMKDFFSQLSGQLYNIKVYRFNHELGISLKIKEVY